MSSNKSKTTSKNSKIFQETEKKKNEVIERPASSKPKENDSAKTSEVKLIASKELNLKEMIGIIFDSPEIPDQCFSIIDETTRVSAFLRHRDTNYLDCLEKQSMEPERLRIAVISAIRYGKVLIFDLIDSSDLIDYVERSLNEVNPNLFKELCDFSILKNERYLDYVKEKDGEDFKSFYFTDLNIRNFRVIFLSTKLNENLMKLGKSFIIA